MESLPVGELVRRVRLSMVIAGELLIAAALASVAVWSAPARVVAAVTGVLLVMVVVAGEWVVRRVRRRGGLSRGPAVGVGRRP